MKRQWRFSYHLLINTSIPCYISIPVQNCRRTRLPLRILCRSHFCQRARGRRRHIYLIAGCCPEASFPVLLLAGLHDWRVGRQSFLYNRCFLNLAGLDGGHHVRVDGSLDRLGDHHLCLDVELWRHAVVVVFVRYFHGRSLPGRCF